MTLPKFWSFNLQISQIFKILFNVQSDQKSLCAWRLQYNHQVHRDFSSPCILILIISHYDVRRNLVQTTYAIAIYSSNRNSVFGLKMAYRAETCHWW